MAELKVIQGDITQFAGDAIVNAANTSLLGGGGVDGAIHRKAGNQLLAECRTLGGCPTGEAKITKGYNLPAKHVIHTVGPVWGGGKRNEEELLQSCYLRSLHVALENNIKTIAFPCISTGIYRFPKDPAAVIAINTVRKFTSSHPEIKSVTFVCFNGQDLEIYQKKLAAISSQPSD